MAEIELLWESGPLDASCLSQKLGCACRFGARRKQTPTTSHITHDCMPKVKSPTLPVSHFHLSGHVRDIGDVRGICDTDNERKAASMSPSSRLRDSWLCALPFTSRPVHRQLSLVRRSAETKLRMTETRPLGEYKESAAREKRL